MRKIIQIATNGKGNIIALCGDGTLWEQAKGIADSMKWNYIPTTQVTASDDTIQMMEYREYANSEFLANRIVPHNSKDMDIEAEYAKGGVDKFKAKMESLLNRIEKEVGS